MHRTPLLRLVLLATAVTLAGCASPNVQVGVNTRSETYDPTLDVPEILSAEPARLAILPATVSGTSVGFAPFVNISIDRLVRQTRGGEIGTFLPFLPGLGTRSDEAPPLSIYSVSEVVNGLNAYGLGSELTALLDDTSKDSIADRDKLQPIAQALGVEYLMIPWLAGVHTDNANRFTFAGLSFIRTGWISIEITLQLWHAPTGHLVWQSVGSGNIVGEGVVGTSPALADSIEQILRPMLQTFISGESDVVLATELKGPTPATAPEEVSTEDPNQGEATPGASEDGSSSDPEAADSTSGAPKDSDSSDGAV